MQLWDYYIILLLFSNIDWARWAALFEDKNFEIYQAITKTYIKNKICNIIEKLDWDLLIICKILDHVKTYYYEIQNIWQNRKKKKKIYILRNSLLEYVYVSHFGQYILYICLLNSFFIV